MSTDGREYLDRKQVADLLGVSSRTAYRMWKDGRLPEPIRLGWRVMRWRRSAIERFLDNLAGQAASSRA